LAACLKSKIVKFNSTSEAYMKKFRIPVIILLTVSIFSCTSTEGGSFRVASSEKSSDIYLDGKYKGRGTAYVTTDKNTPIPVRIETADFKVFEGEVKPEYLNDDEWLAMHPEEMMTWSQTLTLALGLPGVSFLIAGLLLGDYATVDGINQYALIGGVMTASTIPFIIDWFTPKPYWKESYSFNIAGLSLYDSEGYHKETGFNKFGHNRAGKFTDGSSFTGRLVSGKKASFGTWTTAEGLKYTGTFSDDKLSGIAITEFKDGYKAYGRWDRGLAAGVSVTYEYDGRPLAQHLSYEEENSVVYLNPYNTKFTGSRYNWILLPKLDIAAFKDYPFEGYANGPADAVTTDYSIIVENGIYKDGRLVQGKMTFLKTGEVREGRFDGDFPVSGSIKRTDGTGEAGQFENGAIVNGTKKYPNGDVYTGQFKGGKPHGTGKMVWGYGSSFEGGFANGEPHGPGIYKAGDLVERAEYYEGRRIDETYKMRQFMEELRQENEREAERLEEELEQARLEAEQREYDAYVQSKWSSDSSSSSVYQSMIDSLQEAGDTITGGRTVEQMHDDLMSEATGSSKGSSSSGSSSSSDLSLSSSSSTGSNSSNQNSASYSSTWSAWGPFEGGMSIWQFRYMQIGENRYKVEVKTMGSMPSIRKDGVVAAAKVERVEVMFGRTGIRKTMEITEGEPSSISFTADEDLSSSYAWTMRVVSRTKIGEKPLSKNSRQADGSVGAN